MIAAEAAAGGGGMASLEIETSPRKDEDEDEEMESLVAETTGNLKQRSAAAGGEDGGASAGGGFFAALMERNQNFSFRNLLLMGGLAGLVFFFVKDVDRAVFSFSRSSSDDGPDRPPTSGGGPPPGGFHGSSFGGVNNLGHPAGAKAFANGEFAFEEIFVPVSNVGNAVPSIGPENVLNFVGHYVHDEHRSPYASHLYKRPLKELDEEQRIYEKKMDAVRSRWGAWDFKDDYEQKRGESRPVADFGQVKYRDLPNSDFPPGSWQTDRAYVAKFLVEAKGLVNRVKEGIYAEYGQPTIKADGTKLAPAEIAERDKRFAVAHGPGEDRSGKLGVFDPKSWDGLVTKLLHSMIANDEFYVVMGGHSAAAGHGNNFRQAKMMAFHHLMEPVFDKLGMRLISRNMAQGGVGTTHSAFASGSLYGEKDVMFWDSGMTEKGAGSHDLFNKQAILGGERVPVLMNSPRVNILGDTNGTAWVGNCLEIQWNAGGMVPFTTHNQSHAESLPFAVRYMFCSKEAGGLCQRNKYDAVCWQPRSDFEPTKGQAAHPGSQVSWHPGVRTHRQAGRVYSMVMLHALDDAIDRWQKAVDSLAASPAEGGEGGEGAGAGEGEGEGSAGGVPLPPEDQWHVGPRYGAIQEVLRTKISTSREGSSACEKMLGRFPRACRVAMRGFGEWTPRRNPAESSLLSILKPAPNGYLPHQPGPTEYAGIDVLPLSQRVPEGEVDVHAIAIASTAEAPHLDHSMADEDERRRLAGLAHEAVRRRLGRARERHERRRRELREQEEAGQSESAVSKDRHRRLDGEAEIVPGRGWVWSGQSVHFCDGSYTSECGRDLGMNCLIGGHNDGRGGFVGDPMSGWLVMTVPKVKEGLILLRIEWWAAGAGGNALTKDWNEVNDGKTKEEEPEFVFPDVTPKVNATTPFAKMKKAKEDEEKEKEKEGAKEEAAAQEKAKAPSAPAAPAPAAPPAAAGTNVTANATRSLLLRRQRTRKLAMGRASRQNPPKEEDLDANSEFFEYPFEDIRDDSDLDWSSLTESDFISARHRRLGGNHAPIPDDWSFDIAINGKVVKTMNKAEFMSHAGEIVKNWAIWPIMDEVEWAKRDWDEEGVDGEDVEVAVRMRSEQSPKKGIRISHVYYA